MAGLVRLFFSGSRGAIVHHARVVVCFRTWELRRTEEFLADVTSTVSVQGAEVVQEYLLTQSPLGLWLALPEMWLGWPTLKIITPEIFQVQGDPEFREHVWVDTALQNLK